MFCFEAVTFVIAYYFCNVRGGGTFMWNNTIREEDKVYLEVPFIEKDNAKSLGARWDIDKKKWYYTGNDNKDKFVRWLPKPSKPIMKLNKLSAQQRNFVELVQLGKNVLVDACIGSGKTTAIQVLCNEIKDKQILYLTYNTLLKVDAKEKIRNSNTFVTNYHGFAYNCLKKAQIPSGVSDLIQIFLKNKNKVIIPHYDLLIIDEYQDIEQEIAEMLECIKKANPNIQIVAVGDMKQKIYDKTTLDVANFINDFLVEYELLNFTKCFRLNAHLASKLGNIWGKEIIGVNKKCKVREMQLKEVERYLAEKDTSEILCLGARTGDMSRVLNSLEKNYPDKFNKNTVYASINEEDKGSVIPNKSTAIFTTFDSSKGLERKTCVVFDYTEDYWSTRINKPNVKYEILRNIFLVAASRGKDEIIFVNQGRTLLSDETISTPVIGQKIDENFQISQMFDFKYKEDIEDCFKLLKTQQIPVADISRINIKNSDAMIDLSPCVGVLQEASYFDNYDIDSEISYAVSANKDRPPLKMKENATVEEKILYLTAYETYQDRYIRQVAVPFVSNDELYQLHDRLATVFTPKEVVQTNCSFSFLDAIGIKHDCEGICDVLKDNTVWELKFVEELSHTHYLQCACYMIALGLDKGVLWNVRTNEQVSITIPDKNKFLNAVVKAITKGKVLNPKFII